MQDKPVVDLATSGLRPAGRPSKRLRLEHEDSTEGRAAGGDVIDLSESPVGGAASSDGASRGVKASAIGPSRGLWGEMEEPPQWRRRAARTRLSDPPPPEPRAELRPPSLDASLDDIWVAPSLPRAWRERPLHPREWPGGGAALWMGRTRGQAPLPVPDSACVPVAGEEGLSDAEMARRLQEREDAVAACEQEARRLQAEEDESAGRHCAAGHAAEGRARWGGGGGGFQPVDWPRSPAAPMPLPPRPRPAARRRSATSLAEAMMGLLAEGGALGGRMPRGLGSGPGGRDPSAAFAAMREAFAGLGGRRLPPHLLLSDRDFDEHDYEALLQLDEGIENRRGASEEVINRIPCVAVGMAAEGSCSICLEDFEAGAMQRLLPCGHHFHRGCLDTWLAKKATCPICQRSCK